jgi:hypothetical protein
MRVDRAARALVVVDLSLVAAYFGHVAVGQPTFKVRELLDLNSESSLAVWYSSVKLFAVALVTGLFAVALARVSGRETRPVGAYMLGVLALMVLAMSIDEIVQLHEWVSARSDALLPEGTRDSTAFRHTGIWTFVVGIPAAVAFAFVLRGARSEFRPEDTRFWQFAGGLFLLLLGALGVETLSNAADDIESTAFKVMVGFEEGLELLGATLMFAGIVGRTRPRLVPTGLPDAAADTSARADSQSTDTSSTYPSQT